MGASVRGGTAAVLIAALVGSGAAASWALAAPSGESTPAPDTWATRARVPTSEVVRRVGVIDGDTFVAKRPGSKRTIIVRNAGIQAMEDRECGKKQAKKRLSRLLGKKVVITSQTNQARPNGKGIWRLQRNAFTKSGRDIQAAMLRTGLVLPYGIGRETMRQAYYAELGEQAARAGRGLFSGTYCRSGPVQEAPLQLQVNYDVTGNDWFNLGDKFVRIRNLGPVAVPVGKWRLRGAAHDSFYFPSTAVIPAYGEVMVRLGSGLNTATTFYWPGDRMRFFVPGESKYQGGGAYLFDRDGDIRAWSMYPCRVTCTHPAQGALKGRAVRGDSAGGPDASPTISDEPTISQSPRPTLSGSPSGSSTASSSSTATTPLVPPRGLATSSSGSPSSSTSQTASGDPSGRPSTSAPTPSTSESVDPDRRRERVVFTNTSAQTVDLGYTVFRARGLTYEFPLGTVVNPGEDLVVFTGAGVTTRLQHFLGLPEPFFFVNPAGASARIRTHNTVLIACADWGQAQCRP